MYLCSSVFMKLFFFVFLIHLFNYGHCRPDVHIGYLFTLAVPQAYDKGFIGRAFLMETNQMVPNFRAALSIEALNGKYSCSLDVFLGDVKVWSSGHLSQFYTMDKCVLEITQDGDLHLKGGNEQVGWRAGTSGQGVQRLNILKTGNLVLVDAMDHIKWQSFNFPTDIMLWGQRLNVKTRLTSFPNSSNSSSFYSFEIQHEKIALYLNSGKWKYSYWEFKPSKNRNITFVGLTSNGLEIFNDQGQKIAQILSQQIEPLRFLALSNQTGNLGLYYYSEDMRKFQASIQALNSSCDLPMACKPYGICTFSNACSCIRLITRGEGTSSDCSRGISDPFCGRDQVEMADLEGVTTVLKGGLSENVNVNVTKEVCEKLCIDDCECVAALYSFGTEDENNLQQCFLYGVVAGVRQVERGSGVIFMVKIQKGSYGGHGKSSGLRNWMLVVIGVADGLIIFGVLGALLYFVIRRRRRYASETSNTT